ncbi:MAG: PKD domain-containing protein [Muribaculaceae bacterium]|nr:PKD domain-containing protein [Muribaculaceae bacterium]
MKHILITAIALASLSACNSVELIDIPPTDPTGPTAELIDVEVLDYSPAPGQFVNQLPTWTPGDDADAMRRKAQEALNAGKDITLGAFGGSVTLKLSQPIENRAAYDFRIRGNALLTGVGENGREYGSSEPGIVEVMCDENGNGLPDDTWYELKGINFSESSPCTITYYYNDAPDETNAEYIKWSTADGSTGWLPYLKSFHSQPYWPQWMTDYKELSTTARRLPDNGIYNPATARYDLYCYQGYADAYPDSSEKSALDISFAIDADGRFVRLDRIHFLRITTGVLQVNGPLGECSTEVAGVEILNY